MHCEYKVLGPSVRVETDEHGLTISSWLVGRRIEWASVVAAGMMAPSPVLAVPALVFPLQIVPGFNALAKKAESLHRATVRIWIAYRRAGRLHFQYITLPKNDSGLLISELHSHIGERWRYEFSASVLQLRREFGLSNWWFWPTVILSVIAVLVSILMGLLAWAAVLAVLTDIRIALVILFVFAAWWLYKQFRTKPRCD